MEHVVFMALLATVGTWGITALGAATVLFFKHPNRKMMNGMLGFASGVMIAASFWSLLQPAIEQSGEISRLPPWIIPTAGFLCGALFLWGCDRIIRRIHRSPVGSPPRQKERLERIVLLVLSITLHNIPEGLAVGVAFGALAHPKSSTDALMGAVSIAVGIGLQNFPEGAAVSIPLRREGFSRKTSFLLGQASGMAEPIAGVLGALLVVYIKQILPFSLAFAAGAMMLVAVHELIPECQLKRQAHSYFSTMGILGGFALMMLLDVALG